MKKTEHYQFNLIEKEDTFSPDPLNENTQKLEDQLDSLRAEAAESDAALEQRVQVLELHKVAAGYYIGNGEVSGDSQIIEVGFTPKIVITDPSNSQLIRSVLCVEGYPNTMVEIVPGGFKVHTSFTPTSGVNSDSLNSRNAKYRYLALC